jgi:LPS-assembly lipoprotein
MKLHSYKLYLATLITCLTLTGCGFKLRGSHLMPAELKTMHLHSVDKYSQLAQMLTTQLTLNDISLIGHADENPAVAKLQLFKDKLDRRTLSLFPNGQVAEYELIYSVRYTVTIAQKEPQTFNFEIYRDYQDDPQSALAKSKELKLILKEMRQQAADKVIRQLASLDINN